MRKLFWIGVFFLLSLILFIEVLHRFLTFNIDDSLFFVRYAHHLKHYKLIGWNFTPTWGLTSLTYLFWVFPIYLLFPHLPHLVVSLASALSGILFILIIVAFLLHHPYFQKQRINWLLITLTFFIFLGPQLGFHLASGLETTFSLVLFSLWLILTFQIESTAPTKKSSIIWGILSGILYFTRPELILFPAIFIILKFMSPNKKKYILLLISFLSTLFLLESVCFLYFKTPFPLPFYVKQKNFYGTDLETIFGSKFIFEQFKLFFFKTSPIWIAIIISFFGYTKKAKLHQLFISLSISIIIFYLYHAFWVTPICGEQARYLYPTFPAILFIFFIIGEKLLNNLSRLKIFPSLCIIFSTGFFIFSIHHSHLLSHWKKMIKEKESKFLQPTYYASRFYGISYLKKIPLTIAATELGEIGAYLPEHIIIDISGLNNIYFAKYGFDAKYFFSHYQVDWIYWPPEAYDSSINSKLLNHPEFRKNWEYYRSPKKEILSVAIKKTGKYYPLLKKHLLRDGYQKTTYKLGHNNLHKITNK